MVDSAKVDGSINYICVCRSVHMKFVSNVDFFS